MSNYLKSEWYRILHTKEMYLLTGIFSVLVVLMNAVLYVSNLNIPEFRYATVSFSFNGLLSTMSLLFLCGALVAGLLFCGDRRNGVMKNSVAYGLSRTKIFISKCIISCSTAFISLVIILVFYVSSACLLLDGPCDVPLQEMALGVGSTLLNAFGATILATALFQFIKKDILSIVVWYVIMMIIPKIFFLLGMRYEVFRVIADWMPWNFLESSVSANMSGYSCLWETPEGLFKCLITGIVSIIVFLVSGILLNRKKNL